MTGAEKYPTTKPGLRSRVQSLAGVGAGMVGLCFVTAITASVVVPAAPGAAVQVSDLNAQAAQIAQDLVLEQLQIGAYQQQYDVDIAKVQSDETGIGSSEDKIQADISRVRRDRKRLESEAVSAYINLDPEVSGTEAHSRTKQKRLRERCTKNWQVAISPLPSTPFIRTKTGWVPNAPRSSKKRRGTRRPPTRRQRLPTPRARPRSSSLSKQSEITGELAVAVAQQQAAQAADAAAAVRAAQAAASRTTTSTTQPAPSATSTASQGGAPSPSSGDPSLPPFLRCVLQVESGGNYDAVSPGGTYMGGFQFSQATWNEAAQLAGMPQLINVPPERGDAGRAGRPRHRALRG